MAAVDKCPCCELVIEDEAAQVRHVERCHPELIRERWKQEGLDTKIRNDSYPSMIEEAIRQCNDKGWTVSMFCAPGKRAVVHLIHDEQKIAFDGEGERLIFALNLAMDRVEYTK